MLDDRGEAKRARRYREYQRIQQKGRVDVVRALAEHRTGRDFLYWLLELGHLGRNPFTANALTTAFQCGEANISQQIQALVIETAPDGYLMMIKEQENDRRIYDTIDGDTISGGRSEPQPDGLGPADDDAPGSW